MSYEFNTPAENNFLNTADLDAGEPEQVWPDFGLELVPIKLNGSDTGRRLILRNGQFISDVSDQYKLLPNERMVQVAEQVAYEVGAVPFSEFGGDWYTKLEDHVIMDDEGRRAHAMYAFEDPVVLPDGDSIQIGFAVHNSIDGSLGFNVGLFTFRHACANMVWMGVNGEGMGFDDRNVLAHYSHKHTAELKVNADELKEVIEATLELGGDVIDAYTRWQDEYLTGEQIIDLIRRFPAKDLPGWMRRVDEAIETNNDPDADPLIPELADLPAADVAEKLQPRPATAWRTYNDFTGAIWHTDSSQDTTKQQKMKELHKVLKPAEAIV